MTALKLLTAPAVEPISLSDVKAQARIDTTADDALISGLITAARQACEDYLNRALITQSWVLWLDAFPCAAASNWWDGVKDGAIRSRNADFIVLPKPPLVAVTSVRVFDNADNITVFPATQYFVDNASEPARLALRNGAVWPFPLRPANGIRIEYVAGYGDSGASVPQAIKQGILSHVAAMYEHRGDMVGPTGNIVNVPAIPPVSYMLYSPYRNVRV